MQQTADVLLPGFEVPAPEAQELARVLVDIDLPHLDHPLEYTVPDALLDTAQVGHSVQVPLAGRTYSGWIVERVRELPASATTRPLKSVTSRLPVLTEDVARAARRIADRHVATMSQVLSVAIPPRHASTEKKIAAQDAHPAPLPPDTSCEAWKDYPHGETLCDHLAQGRSPRAAWMALPGRRDRHLADLITATRLSGRQVIVVMPTVHQAQQCSAALEELTGCPVICVTGEDTPAHRYGTHLRALRGEEGIVVGTRNAVWTPMQNLGLIVVWDDGDDHLVEVRSPRTNALDVAVTRAHIEKAALICGAYTRSVKAQELVRRGWAVSVEPTREALRASTPLIHVAEEYAPDREGASAHGRLPSSAFQMIREGLRHGPVLIQVPAAGYVPVVCCARCRHVARCPRCSGPLSWEKNGEIRCSWCELSSSSWRCPACSGTQLRAMSVGSDRTGEEIGRAFAGVPLTVSSSTRTVERRIDAHSRIVVSTPGAEPHAEGGYASVIIVDPQAIVGRPELWAPEESLRRWMNAYALARPGVPCWIGGGVPTECAQALVRWDPVDYARRLLDEREALGFFPGAMIVALDAESVDDLNAMTRDLSGELIGIVPQNHRGIPGRKGAAADQLRAEGTTGKWRALMRYPLEGSAKGLREIRECQQSRSARKMPLIRVSINPPELF